MGMTIAQKILKAHLLDGEMVQGQEIGLKIDQTLTQDATGTMAYLQFEAMGVDQVKTERSVAYIDHNTLQSGFENADDHKYIGSVAKKHGIYYSKAGNGICHQVHLERFGAPGKTLIGSDSHTPTGGGIGMLAFGAGGLDVVVAMGGGAYYIPMPKMVRVNLRGKLSPWVSAKDVILDVLRQMTVKGGVGKIVEYAGEGVKTFSVGYDITGSEEQRDKAENAGFKIKLDELKDAREFAEWAGLSNKDVQVTAKEFLDIVPTEQYHMDEPLGAPSAIPLYFVSQLASKEVKVVQSGEGADELFGGYWIYHDQYEFSKYFKVPRALRAAGGAVAQKLPPFHGRHFAMRGSGGPEKSYQRACMNYMWDEVPNVLKGYNGPCKPWEWCKPHFDEAAVQTGGGDVITQTQYVDMVSYMPYDICLKADRMSMAHSLELRVPFLDKKVLDVALQLPTDCRVTDEHSKYALRRAAAHLGFPQKVADMPKQPFITPLTVWLQTDLYYERIKEAFTSPAAHEFFNVDYLMKMLNDHRSADFSTQEGRSKLKMMRIWNVYCFLCWYEVFFGETSKQYAPKTQVA